MSERYAIPLLSNVETAPQPEGLPTTIEAFHLALQAEREKVLAELRPTLEREITEHVTAQIERMRIPLIVGTDSGDRDHLARHGQLFLIPAS